MEWARVNHSSHLELSESDWRCARIVIIMGMMTRDRYGFRRTACICALVAQWFLLGASCNEEEVTPNPPPAEQPRSFRMALTPFAPRSGEEARDRTWDFVLSHVDLLALHYDDIPLPWEELDAGRVPSEFREEFETDASDSEGRLLYVAVNPLNQGRTEVIGDASGGPFPAALGPALFSNPRLRDAFITYALYVRETLRPRFMAVGIEVNLYDLANPADFPHLASLYLESYRALKAEDPTLIVFPTFQHEFIIGNNQFSLLELFRPGLDRLGLASYPSSAGFTPSNLPDDYYTQLQSFVNQPIVITETGYGSRPFSNDEFEAPGSDQLQRDYLIWILERAEEMPMEFFVWFFPTDIPEVVDQLPESSGLRFFGSMGLTAAGFRDKAITELWRDNLARPFVSR